MEPTKSNQTPKLKNIAACSAQFRDLKALPFKSSLVDDVKEDMKLEKVIGMSSKGYNAIEVNPLTGDLVYIAGSYLIIYSPKDSKQTHFLSSTTSKLF